MDRIQPAGDADYSVIAAAYARYRRPDPRIAARIWAALGAARTVLNVGAGAGAYEPRDRQVTAVEPSAVMRARRSAAVAAIDATAEDLPFANQTFEAAMAIFSIHQWRDLRRGLEELRRVTRGPIVILTCDPAEVERFWLGDYCPEVLAVEARRYPPMAMISEVLGPLEIEAVQIPADCLDGFQEAYFRRPRMFLDAAARDACSAWSFVDAGAIARLEARLAADLETGAWAAKHGRLLTLETYVGALRLVTAQAGGTGWRY